jgi:hypothetical protein
MNRGDIIVQLLLTKASSNPMIARSSVEFRRDEVPPNYDCSRNLSIYTSAFSAVVDKSWDVMRVMVWIEDAWVKSH